MKKLKITLIFVLSIISASLLVNAHGNVLYGINLDFDMGIKNKIIEAAQNHLNIDENPNYLDYDHELITVKFDRFLEYSVVVNPLDFSIHGFRDDSLVVGGNKNFNQQQRKKIAQKVFDNIPERFKEELTYGEEQKLYSGIYKHAWYRYVNGVYIANDHLEVEIDPGSGNVIAWRLSPFFYSKEEIKTIPAITHNVAQKISEIRFKAKPVDFKPILVYERRNLMWFTKVKSLYPFFVGVNALDGDVITSGSLRFELPGDYDYGREFEARESKFVSNIYNS